MSKVFKTAAAFRAALEERLKQQATRDNVPLATLRLKVAIERLLARVFRRPDAPWLLKGGYAMELRYRPRARTTKDIDLSVKTGEGDLAARLVRLRDDLQQTAATIRETTSSFKSAARTASFRPLPTEVQGFRSQPCWQAECLHGFISMLASAIRQSLPQKTWLARIF